MMIKVLIFDFDGLILDTEGPVFQSWYELYSRYGQELDKQAWGEIIGMATSEHYDLFDALEAAAGTALPRQELMTGRYAREMEMVHAETVLPGVLNWIWQASERGLKLGIASSSSAEWVLGHLARLGLLEHFQAVHTADDVVRTKPDPALYELTLQSLSVMPQEAIVLEDSPNGVKAAKKAGIFTIAVPNRMTEDLPLDHADLRIASLEELDLQTAIRRAEQYYDSH
jgi:HAD superfamily hydrolase (TIGR01509 family)